MNALYLGFVYPVVVHWGWSAGDSGCYANGTTWVWTDCKNATKLGCDVGTCCSPPGDDCSPPGEGWLVTLGYNDFAGSGIVHLLGGTCALVACAFMGARRGRFTKKGIPIDMAGHSVPLAALGGFILLFGFLAFNGGSQVKCLLLCCHKLGLILSSINTGNCFEKDILDL